MVSFKQAIRLGFQNYLNLKGRASRSEYWWWILFVSLTWIAATFIDTSFFDVDAEEFGPVHSLAMLALLCPNVTVAVRRLHDCARSGWWLLIALVPILGFLLLVFWFAQPGTSGENRHGPDPLERDDAAFQATDGDASQ